MTITLSLTQQEPFSSIFQIYFTQRWTTLIHEKSGLISSGITLVSACILRRTKQTLFERGRVKMTSFFSRPWHPSVFHLLKRIFLGTCWSDLSNFCINTTTEKRFNIFLFFGRRNFFGKLLAKKNQFSDFLGGKGYIFESCLYSKFGNAIVFCTNRWNIIQFSSVLWYFVPKFF